MSRKYHINKDTGMISVCSAKTNKCPFGGESGVENHFDSKLEAAKEFERQMNLGRIDEASKKDKLKKMDSNDLVLSLLDFCYENDLNVQEFSKVIDFMSVLHAGQKRMNRGQYSTAPYLEHPLRVCNRITRLGVKNESILKAALLHDTVEDCSKIFVKKVLGESDKISENEARKKLLTYISSNFGNDVKNIVNSVTNDYIPNENKKNLSLNEKNKIYRDHLVKEITDNPSALMVKFSDFMDNAGGLHHNDLPGNEAKIYKMAKKYSLCVDIFEEEIKKNGNNLPADKVNFMLKQLYATKGRINHVVRKYS